MPAEALAKAGQITFIVRIGCSYLLIMVLTSDFSFGR